MVRGRSLITFTQRGRGSSRSTYECKLCSHYLDLKLRREHTVLLETDVRRSDFVVIFFQVTQNWTALNFEVNFRPLIQWDSRGPFNKSLMKLSNLLSECEIRTSEDVRAS